MEQNRRREYASYKYETSERDVSVQALTLLKKHL